MKKNLVILIAAISVATLLSGLTQIVAPAFVLRTVGAEVTPTTRHFFGIVGLFMALFGGLMLQTIYQARPWRGAVLWCACQKLGACLAVFLGIAHGIFGWTAAAVAVFDGLSGILFLYYRLTLQKP